MKISVITIVFNNVDTIEDTILSVASQNHAEVEHIIMDGCSTDGTLDVIKKHKDKIAIFVSEPDDGMYDAMNKGIALATGDVIGFLNGDDFFAYDEALADVAVQFSAKPEIEVTHADLLYVQRDNIKKVVRNWKSREYRDGLFEAGWCPAHPTFYAKKTAYEKYGAYDLSYTIGNDVELMIRFLARYKAKSCYISKVMVRMRMGGISNKSFKNILNQNREILRALTNNGLSINRFVFLAKKVVSRFLQFVTV